jgi:hypothetical protein
MANLETAVKDGVNAAILDIVHFRAEADEAAMNLTDKEIALIAAVVTHYVTLEKESDNG